MCGGQWVLGLVVALGALAQASRLARRQDAIADLEAIARAHNCSTDKVNVVDTVARVRERIATERSALEARCAAQLTEIERDMTNKSLAVNATLRVNLAAIAATLEKNLASATAALEDGRQPFAVDIANAAARVAAASPAALAKSEAAKAAQTALARAQTFAEHAKVDAAATLALKRRQAETLRKADQSAAQTALNVETDLATSAQRTGLEQCMDAQVAEERALEEEARVVSEVETLVGKLLACRGGDQSGTAGAVGGGSAAATTAAPALSPQAALLEVVAAKKKASAKSRAQCRALAAELEVVTGASGRPVEGTVADMRKRLDTARAAVTARHTRCGAAANDRFNREVRAATQRQASAAAAADTTFHESIATATADSQQVHNISDAAVQREQQKYDAAAAESQAAEAALVKAVAVRTRASAAWAEAQPGLLEANTETVTAAHHVASEASAGARHGAAAERAGVAKAAADDDAMVRDTCSAARKKLDNELQAINAVAGALHSDVKVDCVGRWDVTGAPACSVTCGPGGSRPGTFVVVEPAKFGGAPCEARDGDVSPRPCSATPAPCPVDCTVTKWGQWGACRGGCGEGIRERRRQVLGKARHGGQACPALVNHGTCPLATKCPVDCDLSAWSAWSTCDASCGIGEERRSRDVRTRAQHNGAECPALREEVRECQLKQCNVDLSQQCFWTDIGGRTTNGPAVTGDARDDLVLRLTAKIQSAADGMGGKYYAPQVLEAQRTATTITITTPASSSFLEEDAKGATTKQTAKVHRLTIPSLLSPSKLLDAPGLARTLSLAPGVNLNDATNKLKLEVRQGDKGARGPPGQKGDQGQAGQRGKTGPEGDRGERGDPGERGPEGKEGEVGHVGTPGKRGEAITGKAGPQGAEGRRGAPGLAGKDGEVGDIGPPGVRGPGGVAGEPGPVGQRGAKGAPGGAGKEGAPGPPGGLGGIGRRGDRGVRGPPGVSKRIEDVAVELCGLASAALGNVGLAALVSHSPPCSTQSPGEATADSHKHHHVQPAPSMRFVAKSMQGKAGDGQEAGKAAVGGWGVAHLQQCHQARGEQRA